MKTVTASERPVRVVEQVMIELADGCRLAARLWLPEDAERYPVPAILEYLPYRKRDGTSPRDSLTHPYIAGHGYACVRVDMRGNGESDGLMLDEYTAQEQDDAVEVIAWLARQPWCSGAVGMIGISWGGFNGLQVAGRRPPALEAVISLCSTDDRYADDIHFMGGCLLNDNLGWASTMFAYSSRPPDPALLPEGAWRERWLERLEATPLLVANWLRHQRRDAFWRHGSVCEDWAAIQCPVYAVGGWVDGYSNAVPRLLANLQAPCKGLIGPWAHKYPHFATPGPRIGFLQECLRWWDQWLKGVDTGIMAEPAYRVWMQEDSTPNPHAGEQPGRWVAEPGWPSANIRPVHLGLANGRLHAEGTAPGGEAIVATPQFHGITGGNWCPFGLNADMAWDQRHDDGLAVCFDGEPLPERLEILGAPVVTLEVAADRPTAILCARLCDLAPDGASTRVSFGLLNLAHRDGHAAPVPIEPGRTYRVRLQLNDAAHAFAPGHRLRLALATAYWPIAWPAPEAATLTVRLAGSSLELPVRPQRPDEDGALPAFAPAEAAPAEARTVLEPGGFERGYRLDVATGTMTYTSIADSGLERIEAHGLELREVSRKTYKIAGDDPLSAENEIHWTTLRGRGDWRVRVKTRTRMRATRGEFLIEARLEAFEGKELVFARTWDERVPRDLV